jgi:hypothetical protein
MRTREKGNRAQIAGIAVLAVMILGIIITLAPHAATIAGDIALEFDRLDVMGSDD